MQKLANFAPEPQSRLPFGRVFAVQLGDHADRRDRARQVYAFEAVKTALALIAREGFPRFVSQIASFPNLMTRFTKNSERKNERRRHFTAFPQVTRLLQSGRSE